MPTAEEIAAYRERNDCSLYEAKKTLTREELCKELRFECETVSDLADVLIRVLNLEFGGYDT